MKQLLSTLLIAAFLNTPGTWANSHEPAPAHDGSGETAVVQKHKREKKKARSGKRKKRAKARIKRRGERRADRKERRGDRRERRAMRRSERRAARAGAPQGGSRDNSTVQNGAAPESPTDQMLNSHSMDDSAE